MTGNQPPGIGADRFLVENGIVIEDIDNITGKGRIRVGADEWRAVSENGEIIKENTMVKLIKIDGTKAIVKPVEKEE